MIDVGIIITILSNVIMAALGWIVKTQYGDIKELRKLIQDTRENYVHRDEIKEFKNELIQRFDRVETLLIETIRRE